MRTFHWNAPIIIGAGALVLSVFALAPLPLKAGESGAEVTAALEGQQLGLGELKARLDLSDRVAAMQALELALSELGDGVTLVWRRPSAGWSAESSRSRPSATIGAGSAAMSSTRSRSAAISGRSRGSHAGSPTAPGRYQGERELLMSQVSHVETAANAAPRDGKDEAAMQDDGGAVHAAPVARRLHLLANADRLVADRAVSPPFAFRGWQARLRAKPRAVWSQSPLLAISLPDSAAAAL